MARVPYANERRINVRRRFIRNYLVNQGSEDDGRSAPATADCYWVSDTAGFWDDPNNWSATTGGAGGYGIPKAGNDVVFDGEGTGLCTLRVPAICGNLTLNESGASVNAQFDMNGFAVYCEDVAYNCATATSNVLDGVIYASGTAFTVTAMHATTLAAWPPCCTR